VEKAGTMGGKEIIPANFPFYLPEEQWNPKIF
jgi:hypothetical protein